MLVLLHRISAVPELQRRSQGTLAPVTHFVAAPQQQGTATPARAWSQAATYAREKPSAARHQTGAQVGREQSPQVPRFALADGNTHAATNHAGQHADHVSRAAAPGLWKQSVKLAGQAMKEVAVATVVLPVVLPTLAVLHVPASMWAGACLGRVACRNLLGY